MFFFVFLLIGHYGHSDGMVEICGENMILE